MDKIKIVYKKVEELKEYENNPRDNGPAIEAVCKSIEKFGFKNPCIIDSNNVLVCGHTRVKCAKKLGLTEVPCIIADDLTEEQIKAFRLADNKSAELAIWDEELLAVELEGICDIDMGDFGFEDFSLACDVEDIVEDEIPELPEEPKSERGDVYILGRHRLMCGSSTDSRDVEKLMNGKLADMVFTDPPYNVDYVGKTKKELKIKNDKMGDEQFYKFLVDFAENMKNSLKKGGAYYICYAQSHTTEFANAINDTELELRQVLIWVKNTLVMGRQDYQWKHEPILYGWRPGASHQFYGGRNKTTVEESEPTDIIRCDRPSRSELHPTSKPVKLVSRFIDNSSLEGQIVADFFGGGGSTLIGCEHLNRICYIMELDPIYVDTIIKRWEDLTGQKAIKEA